jgi:hypothetical protein
MNPQLTHLPPSRKHSFQNPHPTVGQIRPRFIRPPPIPLQLGPVSSPNKPDRLWHSSPPGRMAVWSSLRYSQKVAHLSSRCRLVDISPSWFTLVWILAYLNGFDCVISANRESTLVDRLFARFTSSQRKTDQLDRRYRRLWCLLEHQFDTECRRESSPNVMEISFSP